MALRAFLTQLIVFLFDLWVAEVNGWTGSRDDLTIQCVLSKNASFQPPHLLNGHTEQLDMNPWGALILNWFHCQVANTLWKHVQQKRVAATETDGGDKKDICQWISYVASLMWLLSWTWKTRRSSLNLTLDKRPLNFWHSSYRNSYKSMLKSVFQPIRACQGQSLHYKEAGYGCSDRARL